jgi:hypothetical protein
MLLPSFHVTLPARYFKTSSDVARHIRRIIDLRKQRIDRRTDGAHQAWKEASTTA